LDESVKNVTQPSEQISAPEATTSVQASERLEPQQPRITRKRKEPPAAQTPSVSMPKKRRKLRESSINLPREPKSKNVKVTAAQKENADDAKIPKKRGRKRKSELATPETSTPIPKTPRKEKPLTTPKTPKEKTPKEITPNEKTPKENTPKNKTPRTKVVTTPKKRERIKKKDMPGDENVSSGSSEALKTSSLSVLVNEIDGNYKIPCLVEEGNCLFKYIYSVKKDSQSTLCRYSVINCKGKIIAVKSMNFFVNDEYLTDERLDKMNSCLEKALGFARIRQ